MQQKLNDLVFIQYNKRLEKRFNLLKINKYLDPILLRDVEENDDWVIPSEEELQEFVNARDYLWSSVRQARGLNEEVGVNTRSKRERYRDDDENGDEVVNLNEEVDGLDDVDSDAEPVLCD